MTISLLALVPDCLSSTPLPLSLKHTPSLRSVVEAGLWVFTVDFMMDFVAVLWEEDAFLDKPHSKKTSTAKSTVFRGTFRQKSAQGKSCLDCPISLVTCQDTDTERKEFNTPPAEWVQLGVAVPNGSKPSADSLRKQHPVKSP